MEESILNSIKKLLGIQPEYDHFDQDLIIHINSCFATLHQLHVGTEDPFVITGDGEAWGEFIQGELNIQSVKTYIYLKVKILFDSSSMGAATLEAYQQMANEYEWRLNVAVDPPNEYPEVQTEEEEVNWGD